jgi:hypothetical protein
VPTQDIDSLILDAPGVNDPALTLRGVSGHTGDLLRISTNADVGLWVVDGAGQPRWVAAGNQQTTVGAAGGASALPATPTKYLKVKDSAGTVLVVPAYAP